eukprot:TRINITY_DN3989_c0_g1_i1.p4 TRINITY_DN3989_c0_g1~~TRINITY_DN3989_c0_g1_i1.p4  ORF type:complete len:185 (-),score=38.65 TRINITY_DN3989_c0_g1_i1:66-620(-)
MLKALRQAAKPDPPCVIVHHSADTLADLTQEIFPGDDPFVMLCCHVFEKKSKKKRMPGTRDVVYQGEAGRDDVEPRVFLLTSDEILLLRENYTLFPPLQAQPAVKASPKQSGSRFEFLARASLSDVARIRKAGECEFSIDIEGEEERNRSVWQLVTTTPESALLLISALSLQWQQLFRVPLSVQ